MARLLDDAFSKNRRVDDLTGADFQSLRASFAKKWGAHRLGGKVHRARTMFKFGFDTSLNDKPMRFGSMAGLYREQIVDQRLVAVTTHVRERLFSKQKPK